MERERDEVKNITKIRNFDLNDKGFSFAIGFYRLIMRPLYQ